MAVLVQSKPQPVMSIFSHHLCSAQLTLRKLLQTLSCPCQWCKQITWSPLTNPLSSQINNLIKTSVRPSQSPPLSTPSAKPAPIPTISTAKLAVLPNARPHAATNPNSTPSHPNNLAPGATTWNNSPTSLSTTISAISARAAAAFQLQPKHPAQLQSADISTCSPCHPTCPLSSHVSSLPTGPILLLPTSTTITCEHSK